MNRKQVYELVNVVTKEVLGKEGIIQEDLEGVVDLGNELFNANAVDNYVRTLVNHIGKVIFNNRVYKGNAPSVLMDAWEFGSVLEKVTMELPEAQENESWELEDGASYDQNIFYKPKISAKFFNKRVTLEIPVSITSMQVKESFSNATQLNAFISMIYTEVEKSLQVKLDGLVMATIRYAVGTTMVDEVGMTAINVLDLYNNEFGTTLTKDKALHNPEFIRYATYTIGLFSDRMSNLSTLFNGGTKARFTPKDLQHIVLLSEFSNASKVYLQSDTYHKELVALPNHETVAYWQGSGTSYATADTSKISFSDGGGSGFTGDYIIGVIFDRDAIGVSNLDKRVTTHYNAKAEFYNNYYKVDAGYFFDQNENFVVFYLA